MKNGITVSATGTSSSPPDRATITFGASALRPTAAAAMTVIDGLFRALVDGVLQQGVSRSDVQTSDLSIWPETDRDGGPVGYRARNMLNVRITDISRIGEIITAATEALSDSAEIHGLRFTREDAGEIEAEARKKAWAAINQKAEQLAGLAGVTLGRPVSIIESSGAPPAVPRQMKMAAATDAAAVEPGTTIVQVHLQVRFALVG